jgi:hypothetical protein
MDADKLARILADPVAQQLHETVPYIRLAYIAEDGTPRVVPIGYVWNGTHFVVCTATIAAKVAALRKDPHVALTLDTEGFPPKVLLVRGTAEVEIVDGLPDEFLQSSGKILAPEAVEDFEAQTRALYQQMARIRITPTWAKILDFETRLPSAVEELAREAQHRG